MNNQITMKEVALALGRCCEAHPPADTDFQLHPDASLIAGLYGTMIFEKAEVFSLARVSDEIRTALDHWKE